MRPLSKTAVAMFFAKVVGIYALLVIVWPAAHGCYARLFCAAGDAAFRSFGQLGRTDFTLLDPLPGDSDARDFEIKLENIRTRVRPTFEPDRNTRKLGYLPTAFTAALVLATPIPWRRRGWALLWSTVLISAFVGLQLGLHLLNAFSDPNHLNQFAFSPWMKALLVVALKVVAISPVTAYIAPVFIWALVTFRREDWAALVTSAPGKQRAAQ